ncbi:MAG TPA: sodium/proline symporter [Candidatus Stackebrandtia faecavium]|nr:sodium/proline symporter [Candidatus Stackebrandtia faecavium]
MLSVFFIYLVIVFLIGTFASRFMSKSEDGFYLGDRNFGPVATAISAGATDTSGWIFIGAAGFAYATGIATMWMLPGFIIGYLLNWFVVAPRFRRQGQQLNALSMADYLHKRLKDPRGIVKLVSAIIIAGFFLASMAAQLTAAQVTVTTVIADVNPTWSLILSAAFVTGYCLFGGYRAVVWTDVTQGFVMMGVLVLFPIYMIFFELGGPGQFFQTLHSIDPQLLTATGGATGAAAFGFLLGNIGFGIGEPGQPHITQRFLSARDDTAIRQGSMVAMVWVIIVMTGSNLLGLIGRIAMPNLGDPEYVFPMVSLDILTPILAGVVLAAVFAAIQSTFSSQVMVATQSVASDALKTLTKKEFSQRTTVWISRTTMVVLATLATLVALSGWNGVFELVLYAWGGLAAAFGPLLIFCLYSNFVTRAGALAGILSGTIAVVVWVNLGLQDYIYELVPGVVCSTVALVAVSALTRRGTPEKVAMAHHEN